MFGLGKPRTLLGMWIDRKGISQEELSKAAKINRDTVSAACSKRGYIPSPLVMKKILKALREVDASIRADQFWDL
jgi:transcriptional regulator with XRE-family HTH domain